MAAATYFTQIQQIYIAFYQRPADPTGFKYWAERLDLAGGNLSAVIDAFATSPEAALRYGPINAQTISTVIDAIYLALFNKAPDAGGKQFYMDGFASGKFTAGSIALNVLNGATGNDAVSIAHKTQFAQEFTQQVDGRLMTDAYFGTGNQFNVTYSGNADLAAARTMLNGVTAENTSVLSPTQVTELLKAQIADATDPIAQQSSGQTFTLTTGADTMPGLIGTLGTSSTSGNDVIVGTELTLSSGDVINGGNGTDTLRVGNSGGLKNFSSFTLTGVENVQVTADGTGATGFDVTGATGVTKLINDNSSQDVTFTGAGTIPSVGLAVTNVSAGNTTVVFTADAVVGTADALTVALNGNKTIANAAVGTVTVNGIETVNVTTSGASSNLTAIASTSLNAMTVAGDKSLTLAGVTFTDNINVNTLNAAGLTGTAALNVTILANTATLDVAVTGGEGNDRADFSTGFDTRDAFTGGAGRDTLALTQAVATAQTTTTGGTVSGVEILEITNGGTGTTNMDNFVGVDTVYYSGLTGGSALAAASTISNAVTGLTVQVDVDAVAQDQTTTLKTNGTADVANYVFNKVGAADALGTVSAAQFETVNITTADDTTVLGTGVLTIANLTNTVATKLTIAGNAALTIANSNDPDTAVLATIDAGTATAAVTISGTNLAAGGATVTLGSGNDTFNVATAAGADTYDLSKGGNDVIVYNAVAQSGVLMDTITGFVAGSDDINLLALGITASSLFKGVKASALEAQGALTGGGTVSAVFDASTSILWVDTHTTAGVAGGDGTLDANDFRVKLSGVTSISASDLTLATTGVTFTANKVAFNTATAADSTEANAVTTSDDTINATVAFLTAASTVDGLLGADTLNISATAAAGENADLAAMAFTNVETINVASTVETVTMAAADTGTGQATTISGVSGTAQTLAIGATDDLTTVRIRNLETLTDAGANAAVNFTMNTDNFTNITAVTLNGGTADTLILADGTYDFTSVALTFGTAASVLDLVTSSAVGTKTLTLNAADVNNVATITGNGTDGVIARLNFLDTTTLAAQAITEIDTFGMAGADQTLTLDGDDYTTMAAADTAVMTFVGSGTSNLVFAVGGGAANLSLATTLVSGFDSIDFSAASTAAHTVTLDASSISGNATLVGDANSSLALTTSGSYANLTLTAADFDDLIVTAGTAITADTGLFSGAVVAIDGTAGVDPTLAINMDTTTLSLAGIGFGAANGIDTTITGTTGNDTITLNATKVAGSTMTVVGNGGSDAFRLVGLSGNASGLTVVADSVRITDFAAANDQVLVLASGLTNSASKIGVAKAQGAGDFDLGGFTLITDAVSSDFTSKVVLASAVGAYANFATAGDTAFFAIKNTDASQVALYRVVEVGGDADNIDAANDAITLVAVLDVTGAFGLANINVY